MIKKVPCWSTARDFLLIPVTNTFFIINPFPLLSEIITVLLKGIFQIEAVHLLLPDVTYSPSQILLLRRYIL